MEFNLRPAGPMLDGRQLPVGRVTFDGVHAKMRGLGEFRLYASDKFGEFSQRTRLNIFPVQA